MNVISLIASLGSGGFFGLGGRFGGTFEGGKKVAAFAGGGDFIVPSPGKVDSFPMLVSPNERVRVTPANKVSDELNTLKQVVKAVNNMNENMVAGGGGDTRITLEIEGEVITEVVQKKLNRMERGGVNLDEF